MIRKRLDPCPGGGRHRWDPPSGRITDYCTRCRFYRSEVARLVEIAEHKVERRRRWLPLGGLVAALVLMASTALAGSQAVVPPSSSPPPATATALATPGPIAFWPETPGPIPTLSWATYSPLPPTPTPTAKLPTGPVYGTCETPKGQHGTAAEAHLYALVGRREGDCGWWVVNYESRWNPANLNPWSGACGLAQALPCSKMAPGWIVAPVKGTCPKKDGVDRSTWSCYATVSATGRASPSDPLGQVDWFIRYVKSRYGSMFTAWATEQAQGWY